MGQYCVAWLEDEDRSGAETGITSVTDRAMLYTSGDALQLRLGRNHIAMYYAWTEFTAYPVYEARIHSPSYHLKSLRMNRGVALNYAAGQVYDFRDDPIEMIAGENLTGYGYEDDEAGVAHYLGIVAIVTDSRIPKGPKPAYNTIVQATATSAAAGSWQELAMTLRETLPAGEYDMYGADVIHASAVAARFIFPGKSDRPAVIPRSREEDHLHPFSEYWGGPVRFYYPANFPTLNLLDVTGSGTAKIELYLNKVSSGSPQ